MPKGEESMRKRRAARRASRRARTPTNATCARECPGARGGRTPGHAGPRPRGADRPPRGAGGGNPPCRRKRGCRGGRGRRGGQTRPGPESAAGPGPAHDQRGDMATMPRAGVHVWRGCCRSDSRGRRGRQTILCAIDLSVRGGAARAVRTCARKRNPANRPRPRQ